MNDKVTVCGWQTSASFDSTRAKLSRLLRKRKKIEQKLYKIDEKITQLERQLDMVTTEGGEK